MLELGPILVWERQRLARWLGAAAILSAVSMLAGGAKTLFAESRMSASAPSAIDAPTSPGEVVELEGTVQVLVEDRHDGTREIYILDTDDGQRYEIHMAGQPPATLKAGARVRVSGVRSGGNILVQSGSADIQSVEKTPGAEIAGTEAVSVYPNTFGAQRTVVILVNFSNSPSQPYTNSYARTIVFTSASNFDLENSYGQTWLTGDVFGWYTIPLSSSVCDYNTLASLAQTAATAAGAKLGNYTRQVYAFPQNACSWWGLGGPGNLGYSQAWINGDLEEQVVAHEMGHGFGLQHAHSLDCGTVTLGTNCTVSEYGDLFDTMGQSSYHFGAYQKELLGWLGYGSSPPIKTVTASGTYSIDPYETTGSLPKALKIARGTTGAYFYVELRRAVGFDAGLAGNSNVMNGVLVHMATPGNPTTDDLLDMTPGTASWLDPALDVGQTFTDSANGVSITTAAIGSGGASVTVTLGGTPPPSCTHVAPTVSLSPAQSAGVAAGAAVSFTLSLTNRDSATTCTSSVFNLTSSVPAGWTATLSPTSLTAAPGGGASATLLVTSPTSAVNGSYGVSATATNTAAPAAAASASATYLVNNLPVGGGGGTFSDNFNRADSATPGNGWSVVVGSMGIVANELRNGAVKGDNIAVRPTLTGSTQVVSADFASVDNSNTPQLGVILRYQDPQNYYYLYRNIAGGGGRKMRISKFVNGSETILANVTENNPPLNVFFNIKGSVTGTTLTLEIDGAVVLTATDAAFSSGNVGIDMGSNATLSYRADNFSATVQ